MYSRTLGAIANASDFLTYFRKLPRAQQDLIAPHLNEPQQIALKVLNCCSELEGQSVTAIAWVPAQPSELHRVVLGETASRKLMVTCHN
jgi:hypothetical protein